jgi:sugar O-acyltransferase (sialic acid O-acetyltransferase NeuD family)
MIFGLYGPGGFGREVMETLVRRKWSAGLGQTFDEYVFVETTPSAATINGLRVVSEQEFAASKYTNFAITIADASVRQKIADRLEAQGKIATTIISDLASVSPHAQIAPGAIFCDFTMATTNAEIGRHFHCNIYSYVAHDCKIGDFVTFAPAVRCNGNIHIEDFAYIGTSAVLRQGTPVAPLHIGRNAVVGMGAIVTKNVAPDTTVIGNPAKMMSAK